MRLVSNWRAAWRFFSVQALALQGAAAGAWLTVPEDMRAAVPPDWLAAAAVMLSVLGVIGRLVDQGSARDAG